MNRNGDSTSLHVRDLVLIVRCSQFLHSLARAVHFRWYIVRTVFLDARTVTMHHCICVVFYVLTLVAVSYTHLTLPTTPYV